MNAVSRKFVVVSFGVLIAVLCVSGYVMGFLWNERKKIDRLLAPLVGLKLSKLPGENQYVLSKYRIRYGETNPLPNCVLPLPPNAAEVVVYSPYSYLKACLIFDREGNLLAYRVFDS